MIRVAFGSVPKDGGTFTFYRNLRPALLPFAIDMRCVSVGKANADLTEAAFVDDGCVQLAPASRDLKAQARAFTDWCAAEAIDIVFGVNSHAILSALPHLPERVRVLARCANGFDEGYRLTLMGRDRLERIVALVPRLRDDLVGQYGADPARVELIPNGTAPERFAAAAAAARGQGPVIELGFLGRLEHNQKGVLYLPPVLDRLDAAGVPYRLTIAGKGRHEAALREALAPRIADGRVRFAGTLDPDRIPAFLGGIDVFLFTSHFEGCPNALLEAMMAGAVPVSWRLAGITDFLIEDGMTGRLAETGEVAGLADAIAGLAADREGLAGMSRATAAAARARFSTETCARAYVELFRTVMAEPPPPWTPLVWSRFRVDPLFRPTPLARFMPTQHRQRLRTFAGRLRGSNAPRPPAAMQAGRRAPGEIRVHQIINSVSLERGGAERMARRLHEGLQAAGISASLVALEACPVEALDNAVSLGLASPLDPRALVRLGAYARHIDPGDIVHVHLFPCSAHVSALARTGHLKGRLVFTEHSTSNRRRGHALGGLIDDRIYRVFDRIVAISDGVESELVRARPWLRGRTTVIQNGCPLPFDAPVLRSGDGVPVIVSVGRLTRPKNLPAALRALAQLAPREFRYVIAGDGPDRGGLEKLAAELGLADRVEFRGFVADIPGLLGAADIFLIPSAWEGFGLAAVEAMNAGLPVVASDVPGLREVVGPGGEAALLVAPTDPDAIAAALAELCDAPDLRRAMGRRGFERAAEYGLDRFVAAHLDLYDQLSRSPADAA